MSDLETRNSKLETRSSPALRGVLGQSAAVTLLRRLLLKDHLPHALLIEGQPGCGRRTLVQGLAAALVCSAPQAGDACGSCPACVQSAAGTHPDVIETAHDSAGGQLDVGLVRDELLPRVFSTGLMGPRRVVAIYGAERLNREAGNALLKALEEPPAGVYLLLTTANAGAVLRTIRSRTQLVRLMPLDRETVAEVLTRGGMPAAVAAERAAGSAGSHREAREQTAPAPLAALERLLAEGLSGEVLTEVLAALPVKASAGAEAAGRTLAWEQRTTVRRWLDVLAHQLGERLRETPIYATVEQIEVIVALKRDLDLNIAPRLVLEMLAGSAERRRRLTGA